MVQCSGIRVGTGCGQFSLSYPVLQHTAVHCKEKTEVEIKGSFFSQVRKRSD